LPEVTLSGLVTVVHTPANEPQAPFVSVAESRSRRPEAGSTPETESVPFDVVIVSEPVES